MNKDCLWLHRVEGENLWADESVLCSMCGDESVLCCVCGDEKVFCVVCVMTGNSFQVLIILMYKFFF